ncbi:hypothetical protein SAMN02745857_00170 [Andreprevotia lacus DSM 23236]|jgi:predicted dinucleotide-binding enzyme|uniref:Pyrroline-5-carboxylate reductase catalytic N-terminal domain-containing protein n=1 Tax=Andreprevotia lacus DSM 23236 TaxID=1121001 RepID=A0A1W1WXC6_9NEIS|nr:NAD(P)-binding domain-containing protein [Andreprevotia lacus]SMC16379.1 hypothetical protein SAMN02745857_00170 [Andreprevotia lacus DSM 23236]
MKQRILILGAGKVGTALGLAWLRAGHDVRFGVPVPDSTKYPALPAGRLQPASALRDAQLVVLAVPWAAASTALAALGDLNGVIVIDCTNPLGMGQNGLQLTLGFDTSGAEQLAQHAPGASLFKTLNQTGAENMADAGAYTATPVMFVAGDDSRHKPLVLQLVADLGFDAIDAGPLRAARLLEPLAMLWIDLATKLGHPRDFAFARVRHHPSPQPEAPQ